jgi:hypothetical protein
MKSMKAMVAGMIGTYPLDGGALLLRDGHRRCPKKVVIDTNPGWNHFVLTDLWESEAASALEQIEADYGHHERRAREMAETHVDSELVLSRLLSDIGL